MGGSQAGRGSGSLIVAAPRRVRQQKPFGPARAWERAVGRGRPPVVWHHAAGKTPRALLHTIRRHGGRVENVVIVEVDVPRKWLRRSRPGLWYTPRDVPPERIRGLTTFAALARSPATSEAGC